MAVIYQSPSGNHQSYRRMGIVIIAGIAAVAAILLWQRFGRAVSPTLSPVLELAPMETGGQPELTQTARFVNNMFASELPRFKLSRIRVLNEGDAPRQPTERENVYQLSSQLVANEADGATLYLSIDDVRSDTRLWSRIVKLPEGQQAMSQALLPVFGEINGPMGIIAMDGTLITKNSDAGGYPCLLKYFSFVSMRDQVSEKKVADCFKQPVKEPHLEATMLASRAMFAIERRDAKSDYNASLEKGLQLAQAAVLADANDGSANFALARLSYLRNDCASARFYTTRTIEINPHSPMFTSTLAALAKTCNYPQADQLLDLAYRTQNPRFAKGRLLLILASIAQKRPDRIAELASSDLPHSQYNRTNYYLAETLIAASQGRREDAVRLLNLFIKNAPPGNGSLDEALSTIVSIPDRRRLLIKYLQNSGVLQNDGKKSFPSRVSA